VHEANVKNIPVVALVDTNCDPKNVDYVIPSNDDAIRAIKLLVGKIADAVMEGMTIRGKEADEEEQADVAMPAEVSRFMDDEELEDEALLGESTLKHMGTDKKAKADDEDEGEEAVEEAEEPEVQSGGSEAPEKAEEEAEEELEEAEEAEEVEEVEETEEDDSAEETEEDEEDEEA
jgi:small subunit ribosomal protein S2